MNASDFRLKPRELAVLQGYADGKTAEQIAAERGLRVVTVKSYADSAAGKLRARGRLHAVAVALRKELIE